ncbi:MAG: hypothetical protein GQ553_02555, partial [Nitrosomonadaceae bacterium]|nr:hypothetical protein [Nitrosomonadaceae bacterium]
MSEEARAKATELADLLGNTSTDYHNKSIAIDFIASALEAYHQEQLKKASIKATMQKGQAFDAAIYMHINDVT